MSDVEEGRSEERGKPLNTEIVRVERLPPIKLDQIRNVIECTAEMNRRDRNKLIREAARALFTQRQDQIAGALRVARSQVSAAEDVGLVRIAQMREQAKWLIEKDFIEMAAQLGASVQNDKLRFLLDFADQISAFEEEVRNRGVKKEYAEMILKQAEETYNSMFAKVVDLTADLIASTEGKKWSS